MIAHPIHLHSTMTDRLQIADLAKDGRILQTAREIATRVLENDPFLNKREHDPIKLYILEYQKKVKGWSKIS